MDFYFCLCRDKANGANRTDGADRSNKSNKGYRSPLIGV